MMMKFITGDVRMCHEDSASRRNKNPCHNSVCFRASLCFNKYSYYYQGAWCKGDVNGTTFGPPCSRFMLQSQNLSTCHWNNGYSLF